MNLFIFVSVLISIPEHFLQYKASLVEGLPQKNKFRCMALPKSNEGAGVAVDLQANRDDEKLYIHACRPLYSYFLHIHNTYKLLSYVL